MGAIVILAMDVPPPDTDRLGNFRDLRLNRMNAKTEKREEQDEPRQFHDPSPNLGI